MANQDSTTLNVYRGDLGQTLSRKFFGEALRLEKELLGELLPTTLAGQSLTPKTVAMQGTRYLPVTLKTTQQLGLTMLEAGNQHRYLFTYPDGSWAYHIHDNTQDTDAGKGNFLTFVGSKFIWDYFIKPFIPASEPQILALTA